MFSVSRETSKIFIFSLFSRDDSILIFVWTLIQQPDTNSGINFCHLIILYNLCGVISFSVHVSVEEKLRVIVNRDGGLKSMELTGMLTLKIGSEDASKVRLTLGKGGIR